MGAWPVQRRLEMLRSFAGWGVAGYGHLPRGPVVVFAFVTACTLSTMLSARVDAQVIGWHASTGVLPTDSSIDAAQRFTLTTGPSFVISMVGSSHLAVDTTAKVKIQKSDGPLIGAQFAYEVVLRSTVDDRGAFRWSVGTGMAGDGVNASILISNSAVGFPGVNGDSFIDNQFYAMNTTDQFHTFSVQKNVAGFANLYVDNSSSPVLTIPTSHLLAATDEVTLLGTSASGHQAFELRSFVFNPTGLNVPEPSVVPILISAGIVGCVRRGRRAKRYRTH